MECFLRAPGFVQLRAGGGDPFGEAFAQACLHDSRRDVTIVDIDKLYLSNFRRGGWNTAFTTICGWLQGLQALSTLKLDNCWLQDRDIKKHLLTSIKSTETLQHLSLAGNCITEESVAMLVNEVKLKRSMRRPKALDVRYAWINNVDELISTLGGQWGARATGGLFFQFMSLHIVQSSYKSIPWLTEEA